MLYTQVPEMKHCAKEPGLGTGLIPRAKFGVSVRGCGRKPLHLPVSYKGKLRTFQPGLPLPLKKVCCMGILGGATDKLERGPSQLNLA